MKIKISIFILVFVFPLYSFSQSLFSFDASNSIVATKNPENTKGLVLDEIIKQGLIENRDTEFDLYLPFFEEDIILNAQKFNVYSDDFKIISLAENGEEIIFEKPTILSYKLFIEGKSIGVLNLFNNDVNATFKFDGKQYEISKYKNKYILFEASNCINNSNFSCAVDEEFSNNISSQIVNTTSVVNPVCIELAIEVDNYTRNTFSSTLETTNWALAIIAGVSQIYDSEVNAAIVVTYSYIWNTTDPYAAYINQSSNMLSELVSQWTTNNGAINRDLVHLMSKRSNTGTGGIAYLDALCDNSWGYGFSSDLNNDTTYSFPNPSYVWNLSVISHEIGHNIGSHHTHWCNWVADPFIPFAGGIIDNCVDVEGSCSNNPTSQLGTIMSYCHTTSSGIVLDFHDVVVSQALIPGITNSSCLTICDYYGCTDSTAFNYNPNANVDDGSCIAIIYGCIDTAAANFNLLANTDDGTCTYCSALYFNITHVSCNGYNDGNINLTVQNGTAPYTYFWSDPSGFTATSEDISNLLGGTYTVLVTDGFGCSETASVQVINPNPITINNISTTNVTCFGLNNGSVSLNASGGFSPYTIDFGIHNASALTQGVYSVTVTDSNNCPSVNTAFTILEPGELIINPIASDISCNGYNNGSVFITVSGGSYPFSFTWSGPNSYFSPFQNINNLVPGNYNLYLVDANGCSASYNVLINEPNLMNNSINSTNVSCNGGTDGIINISPTGGVQPYSYVWNNGSNLQDQINISAGIYTVNITDVNGCNLPVITTLVTEPPASVINEVITDVDCFGNYSAEIDVSYFPSSAVNQFSYNWSGPNSYVSALEDISNISAGLYILTVLENGVCNKVVSFMVNEPNALVVMESTQNVSCYGGADATVNLSISGGIPIYSSDWFGINPQYLSAGSYLYTITDQNNCTITNTVNVIQPLQALMVNSSVTPVSCNNGSNGTALLNIMGGTAPYSSLWPNANENQLNAGYHQYITTDYNGCTVEDSVFIQQPSPLQIIENISTVLCYGGNTGTANLSLSGATPPYQVDWQTVNNLSLNAGNYMYDVTDINNCIISGILFVSQPSAIAVQNTISPSTCPYINDGSVINIVTGGVSPYTQNWNGFNPQSLNEGNYSFTVVDANGCVDSNLVYVGAISNIAVTEFISNVSCYGFCDGDISLIIDNGVPPYQVDWMGVQPDSLCEGVFSYEIVDAISCLYTDTIQVFQPNSIQLSVIQQANMLIANINGGTSPYSFNWWNATGLVGNSQGINISQTGNYYCVVYDANACNSDTIKFNVLETNLIEKGLSKVVVYPNPVENKIIVELPYSTDKITLSLTDILGRELIYHQYEDIKLISLDISSLSAASYYLLLEDKNKIFRKKIVKQ